jgi:hypothetical protein
VIPPFTTTQVVEFQKGQSPAEWVAPPWTTDIAGLPIYMYYSDGTSKGVPNHPDAVGPDKTIAAFRTFKINTSIS